MCRSKKKDKILELKKTMRDKHIPLALVTDLLGIKNSTVSQAFSLVKSGKFSIGDLRLSLIERKVHQILNLKEVQNENNENEK